MDTRFLLIASVVLITTLHTGDAVHCYSCNTGSQYNGAACETDTLDQKLKVDCKLEGLKDNKNYTVCRKFIQEVEGDRRIVRTCATGGRPDGDCVARTGTTHIKLWYCECRGDGCNTATTTVVSTSFLVVAVVVAVMSFLCLP